MKYPPHTKDLCKCRSTKPGFQNGCNDGIVSSFEVNPVQKSNYKVSSLVQGKQYDILILKPSMRP